MTNAEIMAQILSEASGKPLAFVRDQIKIMNSVLGWSSLDDEVPDKDAQQLLSSLRGELPGIRNWLLEGAIAAIARNLNS